MTNCSNPAKDSGYSLKTGAFAVSITENPFAVSVSDSNGAGILSHVENEGVYLLSGDRKIFVQNCAKKDFSPDKSISLDCSSEPGNVGITVSIENEYEFSMKIETPDDMDILKVGQRFNLPMDESIYGLKEYVVGDGKRGTDEGPVQKFGTLDQRGTTIEMYTRPTISIASPFHINSRGYGLFFDTSWPGVYDMGDTEAEVSDISFEDKNPVMYFTFGPSMGDIIERHTDRVGKTLLPPKWASLVFKWRDDHYDLPELYDGTPNPSKFNSMVYEDVMMLKKLDIPTGVYWLDRPWAKGPFGYDDFEFDENRFPNPAEMIKWLKEEHGMEMLLWVAPWAYGKMRDVAEEKGYLAPNSDKVIDLTNPEAVEWWQNEYHKMFDIGVGGFKLDRCEEVIPSKETDIYHNGKTGREMHNLYPMLYAKAVQGACQKFRGDDCLVMPRSGFTGSQQYAVFWGGDTHPSWRGLRSAVISCLRSNIMGFPVWGSDTGGYGVPASQDLFSRWLQVSAFHPIMEVGGSGTHEPWNAGYEPNYDQIGIDNYRYYAKLHTELAPYNYSYMNYAHKTGRPIVRPLVYEWPDDTRVRDIWDEFMFGDWILAAPILEEGARKREVYLPEGTWIDYWDNKNILDGNQNYLVEAPIDRIPIFIRSGAIIPLNIIDGETEFGSKIVSDKFVIALHPEGGETSFNYYDGDSEVVITLKESAAGVEIDTTGIDKPVILKLITHKTQSISYNGEEIDRLMTPSEFLDAEAGWSWIPKAKTYWIKFPKGGKITTVRKD